MPTSLKIYIKQNKTWKKWLVQQPRRHFKTWVGLESQGGRSASLSSLIYHPPPVSRRVIKLQVFVYACVTCEGVEGQQEHQKKGEIRRASHRRRRHAKPTSLYFLPFSFTRPSVTCLILKYITYFFILFFLPSFWVISGTNFKFLRWFCIIFI